jgi:hypothetical protein
MLLSLFKPLFKSGITILLHVPCLGTSPMIRKCVWLLLSWTQVGGIWLEIPLSENSIHVVTR